VIDFDGTLVNLHSDKEHAAPTYKRGFGFHPLLAYLDATGEALAAKLHPGNAGSNTAVDHVEVLDLALAQLPIDPHEHEIIARTDSTALTHGFIDACRSRSVRFAVGHDLTAPIRTACISVPNSWWTPAITAGGTDEREDAEVAEMTDLIDLSRWPAGTRAIARREDPTRAQLTFTDFEGRRYQVFITDLNDPTSPISKRCIAAAAAPRNVSATPKTPVLRTCHPRTSRSTPRGCSSCSSRKTSSPGPNFCASTANSPGPNRNASAAACCTRPAHRA
jgi:hypothetical protein